MTTLLSNLVAGATTQLTGYDFNSYCRFGSHRLACRGNALCSIGGASGTVEPSASYFETFDTTLGYDGKKGIRHWYLLVETDGTLKITPYFDDAAGRQITVSPGVTRKQIIKVSGCCDEEGSNLRIKVENVNACWFAVKQISVLPIFKALGR